MQHRAIDADAARFVPLHMGDSEVGSFPRGLTRLALADHSSVLMRLLASVLDYRVTAGIFCVAVAILEVNPKTVIVMLLKLDVPAIHYRLSIPPALTMRWQRTKNSLRDQPAPCANIN